MVSTSRMYLHCQVIIHQRRVLDRQRIQPNVCRREGGGEDRSCAERKGNLARKEISQERKSHKKGNLTGGHWARRSGFWPIAAPSDTSTTFCLREGTAMFSPTSVKNLLMLFLSNSPNCTSDILSNNGYPWKKYSLSIRMGTITRNTGTASWVLG